jgi:D-alanyl-D-alanine carboxypeptidase (penicillin-binding protein 5/6)
MTAFARRGLFALLALFVLCLTPTPGAAPLVAQSADNSRYAAVVVDAASGEVLFARHADEARFPASITKVMTLYLTFEALSEGRAKLDDVITVSRHAASQPPSKLGLGAGQTITLDDAMRATAVRSANDMAVAIAEHIGGSESQFAVRMTAKARELGMGRTRYFNANGLPDSRQVTTANDLAILARAVMRDYPQYYHYFGLHDWAYNGRNYRNTNGLLASQAGYDGLKTGYTNASGYNLAASAVRDGKRLITVVLGGRSSLTRNGHVAELMNTGFEVERRRKLGEPIQIAQTFFETRGYGIGRDSAEPLGGVSYASVADEEEETGLGSTAVAYASAPAPQIAPTRITPPPSVPMSARAEARPTGDITASLNGAPGAARRAPAPTQRAPAPAPAGRWAVQVGAFRDETVAREWLSEVARRFRTQFAGATRDIQTADGWRRSRFTGLTESAARSACAALAERRVTCMVVRPD